MAGSLDGRQLSAGSMGETDPPLPEPSGKSSAADAVVPPPVDEEEEFNISDDTDPAGWWIKWLLLLLWLWLL